MQNTVEIKECYPGHSEKLKYGPEETMNKSVLDLGQRLSSQTVAKVHN